MDAYGLLAIYLILLIWDVYMIVCPTFIFLFLLLFLLLFYLSSLLMFAFYYAES